jgi:YD repeat-containing protein
MRSLTTFVSTAALVLITASGGFSQGRPDFSGTWTLDPASAAAAPGGGRGGGMNLPQQLTFTQTADVLTMSWTQDGRKITETMNLAGAEQTTSSGNVMKVTWEANRIVVVIRANLGGNVVEQRRVFSMEGGNLVIELARPDVQGGTPTVARFVYKRGEHQ